MSSHIKNDLLHEVSKMVLLKGPNGFGLQELADVLKIKKASLFHYFPSKKSLLIDLYRFYQTSFIEWTKKYEEPPSEKQIINYVKKLTDWICLKKRICPVRAMSLEWEKVDDDLKEEILKLQDLHRKWLLEKFKDLDRENKLNVKPKEAVEMGLALIQGSIQVARLQNDPKLVLKNFKNFLHSISKVEK